MAYVITQNCCRDASCVAACPVGCIHPSPGEPGFTAADMLYIDPAVCIDCGACADACPVDAIVPGSRLDAADEPYRELNAAYPAPTAVTYRRDHAPGALVTSRAPLDVGIIGSGPAGMYCAQELLRHPGVRVSIYERLVEPHGLIRYGVAPDHPDTKKAASAFAFAPGKRRRLTWHLNTRVGTDVTVDDLRARHHAVIAAYGAGHSRRLDVPGAGLPGVLTADAVAGWYNGHPEHRHRLPNLDTRRAVIVGNGNVALDIARVLASGTDRLAAAGLPEYARTILRDNTLDEVVILGRRGPEHAACTEPELLELSRLPGIDLIADAADLGAPPSTPTDARNRLRRDLLTAAATRAATRGNRRVVLAFHTRVTEILGDTAVSGVRTVHEQRGEAILDAGLVIGAIGFTGAPLPGVGFDAATGTVPNTHGRVLDDNGEVITGMYTAGWIKRGPSGVIGTNRACAQETVAHLLADHRAGLLAGRTGTGVSPRRRFGGSVRRALGAVRS